MKFGIRKGLVCLILVCSPLIPLSAENAERESVMILAFADDELEVEVTDADGMLLAVYIGMELTEGMSVRTDDTGVELQLEPNGSILKMNSYTLLKVEGFQRNSNSANDFTLRRGSLRVVATSRNQGEKHYNFFTQTAVCSVRGTDFLLDGRGRVVVAEGVVELIKSSTGEAVRVSAGMAADVATEVFETVTLTDQEISQEFRELRFKTLVPEEVPRTASENTAAISEEKPETEATKVVSRAVAVAEPERAKEPEKSKGGSGIGGLLGMEIGSFTADGESYAKLIFQPTFSIGKFKASLFLPLIYKTDLFDFEDWYKPAGNNEWSFGSDQSDAWNIVSDAVQDLVLKIRYLKWGEQGNPFYFKLGNLNDMTLGHGILMLNYANDVDFPAVRKVGLNLGINTPKITLEVVGDDLSNPQVFGLRVAFRPFSGFPLGFGFSGVTDIKPAKDLAEDPNLMYINPAFDLDFPILKDGPLSLVLFGDIATMLPVLDGDVKLEYFYNEEESSLLDRFQNYGFATGLFGSIFFVDYRIEYRQSTGQFKPSFYNSTYDRRKTKYAEETIQYLESPSSGKTTRGIYGSFGVNIADIFRVSGGYLGPWTDGGFSPEDDYFHLTMGLKNGALPVGVALTYNRSGLIKNIQEGFEFVDASTVLKGEVAYSLSESLDIALLVSSAMRRNGDGTLALNAENQPKAYYTFTLDTRLHF